MKACENVLIAGIVTTMAVHCALAQGPLAPPGSPAPNFKTLQQVEPRTPITSLPFTISVSGSYYLTTNLSPPIGILDGITITANDVTIDLSGFTILGVAGSQNGILSTGLRTNIAVHNGIVRNWSARGVAIDTTFNSQCRAIQVSDCGTDGIFAGPGSIVANCMALSNGDEGIATGAGSAVVDCVAYGNGGDGISTGGGNTVSRCAAFLNGNNGIFVLGASTVVDCSARSNDGDGISGFYESIISRCASSFNDSDGIEVAGDCFVTGNNCASNGNDGLTGAGIHATDEGNHIDGNTVHGNDRGFDVDVGGNLITRNSARGNGANYSQIAAGNTRGEAIDTTAAGGILDATVSPWANFSY